MPNLSSLSLSLPCPRYWWTGGKHRNKAPQLLLNMSLLNILKTVSWESHLSCMETGKRECQDCWLMQAHLSFQEVQLSALQISVGADSSSLYLLAVCSHLFHGFYGVNLPLSSPPSLLIHISPFPLHLLPLICPLYTSTIQFMGYVFYMWSA